MVDIDGSARIAGFGSALILGHTAAESEMSVEWSFRGSAPELMCPGEFGLIYPRNTKASDIYAFGVLAWEARVFTAFLANYSLEQLPPRFLRDPLSFPTISTSLLHIRCGRVFGHHVLITLRPQIGCGR